MSLLVLFISVNYPTFTSIRLTFNLLQNGLFKDININGISPIDQNNGLCCSLSKDLRLCFGVYGYESSFLLVSPGIDGLPASVVQTIMVKQQETGFQFDFTP